MSAYGGRSPPLEDPACRVFRKRARLSPAVSDPDLEGHWPLKRHQQELITCDFSLLSCSAAGPELHLGGPSQQHPERAPQTSGFSGGPPPHHSHFHGHPLAFNAPGAAPAPAGAAAGAPLQSPSLLNSSSPPPDCQHNFLARRSCSASESIDEELMLAGGPSRMSTEMSIAPLAGSQPETIPEEVTSRAAAPAHSTSPFPANTTSASTPFTYGLAPSGVSALKQRRNTNAVFINCAPREANDAAVPASPSDPGASLMTNLRKTALLRSTSMLSFKNSQSAASTGSTTQPCPTASQQPPNPHRQGHHPHGWQQQQQQRQQQQQEQGGTHRPLGGGGIQQRNTSAAWLHRPPSPIHFSAHPTHTQQGPHHTHPHQHHHPQQQQPAHPPHAHAQPLSTHAPLHHLPPQHPTSHPLPHPHHSPTKHTSSRTQGHFFFPTPLTPPTCPTPRALASSIAAAAAPSPLAPSSLTPPPPTLSPLSDHCTPSHGRITAPTLTPPPPHQLDAHSHPASHPPTSCHNPHHMPLPPTQPPTLSLTPSNLHHHHHHHHTPLPHHHHHTPLSQPLPIPLQQQQQQQQLQPQPHPPFLSSTTLPLPVPNLGLPNTQLPNLAHPQPPQTHNPFLAPHPTPAGQEGDPAGAAEQAGMETRGGSPLGDAMSL